MLKQKFEELETERQVRKLQLKQRKKVRELNWIDRKTDDEMAETKRQIATANCNCNRKLQLKWHKVKNVNPHFWLE